MERAYNAQKIVAGVMLVICLFVVPVCQVTICPPKLIHALIALVGVKLVLPCRDAHHALQVTP